MQSDQSARVVLTVADRKLSVAQIAAIADRRADLSVSTDVLDALGAVRSTAVAVAASRPVYGRTTGVGANKSVDVGDRSGHALALLRSHATSGGVLRDARRVRAMLAIRAAQLAAAGSGVAPEILTALLDRLAADALPPVRELGSIGTGDLSALATTALALIDDLSAAPGGRNFDENDALAFISSNAATLADAALGVAEVAMLAQASLAIAALTFTAIDGNAEAYSSLVETVTPFVGAREVCRAMRALVAPLRAAARIQDPFGLRVLPQVHGVLLDSTTALVTIVEALSAVAGENPLFAVDPPAVAHHGGFHMAYLATALDTVRSALAQSAQLNQARLSYLIDPSLTGLAPFLGDGTPAASGVMVVEYVAASALAQLRSAAAPVAIQSISISRGVEDDASFAALGAHLLLGAGAAYRTLLAAELVAAVRAIRLRQLKLSGPVAELVGVCAGLSADFADRDLTDDLAAAEAILPELAAAAERLRY